MALDLLIIGLRVLLSSVVPFATSLTSPVGQLPGDRDLLWPQCLFLSMGLPSPLWARICLFRNIKNSGDCSRL